VAVAPDSRRTQPWRAAIDHRRCAAQSGGHWRRRRL